MCSGLMSYETATTTEQRQGRVCGFVASTGRTEVKVKCRQGEKTHARLQLQVWRHQSVNDVKLKASPRSAEEVDGGSAASPAFGMNRSRWLAAATGCSSCAGSERFAARLSSFTADSLHRVCALLAGSPPAAVHDGILSPAEASLHELPGSVGPGPLPCQLTSTAAVQHQRVEQVR